jgi:hypothetical protein
VLYTPARAVRLKGLENIKLCLISIRILEINLFLLFLLFLLCFSHEVKKVHYVWGNFFFADR